MIVKIDKVFTLNDNSLLSIQLIRNNHQLSSTYLSKERFI